VEEERIKIKTCEGRNQTKKWKKENVCQGLIGLCFTLHRVENKVKQ